MCPIFRATHRGQAIQAPAFNFEDLRVRADDYLAKVRDEGRRILEEAVTQAAEIRRQAQAEGLAAADTQLSQRVQAQLEPVLPAIKSAIDEIRNSHSGWLAHWEQRATTLSVQIAERILRRELVKQPDVPVQLVREALELAAGSSEVRLRMHPEDLKLLREAIEPLTAAFSRLAPAEIVADPAIQRGGCRVETLHGAIDQQFSAQLERIEEELS